MPVKGTRLLSGKFPINISVEFPCPGFTRHDSTPFDGDFGRHLLKRAERARDAKKGAPLNEWDKATFYGGGAKGYTDYPTLGAAQAAE